MRDALRRSPIWQGIWRWGIAVLAVLAAAYLGLHPSRRWLAMIVAGIGGLPLLLQPVLGLPGLVVAALAVPMEFGTGTAVSLNPATLLVPGLFVVWVLKMMQDRHLHLAPSRANGPLFLFLVAGIISLLAGNALWDPAVPRLDLAVQLAQWAIFAFSALAFWLAGNIIEDDVWLRRLTFTFLAVGGGLAMARVLPGLSPVASRVSTQALIRAPFWMLLTAVAGGQLLFNGRLGPRMRFLLTLLLGVIAFTAFFRLRESASTWVGVGAAVGVLLWLRWPHLRWPAILLVVALGVTGFLQSAVWQFAGGQSEWVTSGGSRLALIGRVVSVTLRNPITGLGPASYRPYAGMEPLAYGNALWLEPDVSSHNNYVDLFAHTGLLGLVLFFWFAVEVARLGLRLHTRFKTGFVAGYVNGVLAAGAASMVVMLLADWILPFVYNIGFPGFQASVLVWLFTGGLVAIDHMSRDEPEG